MAEFGQQTIAATQIKVTVSSMPDIRFRELMEILDAINYAVEFSLKTGFLVAIGDEYESPDDDIANLQYYLEDRLSPSEIESIVRVRRARYGSPIQIVIDLKPIMDFLTHGGYMVFLAAVWKLFNDSAGAWKNIEDALRLRRENHEAHVASKANRNQPESPSETAEREEAFNEKEQEADLKIREISAPIADALMEGPSGNYISSEQAQEMAERRVNMILDSKDYKARMAAAALRGRAVTMELE